VAARTQAASAGQTTADVYLSLRTLFVRSILIGRGMPAIHRGTGRGLMYGGLVKFVVKPGMRSEFLEFLRWDAKVAKDTEPGTLRFDVWTSPEPDVVYVYETYTDEEALEVHKNNEPCKKFLEVLQHEMLEEWGEAIPFAESITSNIDE
jgi:quinol monooxygenase YgiN